MKCQTATTDEIEANPDLVAAAVLRHPLAPRLGPSTLHAVQAIAVKAGPGISAADASRLLRQTIDALDLAEISAGVT